MRLLFFVPLLCSISTNSITPWKERFYPTPFQLKHCCSQATPLKPEATRTERINFTMIRCSVRRVLVGSRLGASRTPAGLSHPEALHSLSGNNSRSLLSEIQTNSHRTSMSSMKLYSSKPSHDDKSFSRKEVRESPATNEDSDGPIENEAISLFFEKRKAALAKKQKRDEQRGDTSAHNQRRNERRPAHGSNKQNRHQHDKRRWDNGKNGNYRRRNNNRNDESNFNDRKQPEGLSDVLQVMSRQRDGNRNQFRHQQSSH